MIIWLVLSLFTITRFVLESKLKNMASASSLHFDIEFDKFDKTDDWQTQRNTLQERNKFMFKNKLMSDIKFTFDDPKNEERRLIIHAHKYVLAIGSPVFQFMFYGSLQEKNDEIYLPDCSYGVFSEFLRFLYYDEVEINIETAVGLLYLAEKYMIPLLATNASLYLKGVVSPENVFETLFQARQFNVKRLERRCWDIVDLFTAECLESEGFKTLDQATLKELLRRDTLMVDEEAIFRAVMLWARNRCDEMGRERDGKSLREIIGDALYQIRFPLMAKEAFANEVATVGLLEEGESLSIMLYFTCVNTKLRFLDRKRKKKRMRRCRRINSLSLKSRAFRSGVWNLDDVSFRANEDILVAGARIFTGPIPDHISLKLTLADKENTVLAEVETKQLDGQAALQGKGKGMDVLYERPVLLLQGTSLNCRLTATCTTGNEETNFKYASDSDFLPLNYVDGVEFTFIARSGQGHILEILFYPLL